MNRDDEKNAKTLTMVRPYLIVLTCPRDRQSYIVERYQNHPTVITGFGFDCREQIEKTQNM